eukprot:762072-Amphidinium_carterae.2
MQKNVHCSVDECITSQACYVPLQAFLCPLSTVGPEMLQWVSTLRRPLSLLAGNRVKQPLPLLFSLFGASLRDPEASPVASPASI